MKVSTAGIYGITPGFGALRDALRRHGDKTYVRRELACLVLVELEVRGATGDFDIAQLHQPSNENVPYDERYFSLDRRALLGEAFQTPSAADFAVAFFLHAFEAGKPLQAPWGIIPLGPPEQERPEHLRAIQYQYYD